MGKQIVKLLPVVLSLILQGGTVAAPAQEVVPVYPEVQSGISTQENQDQIRVYMHQTGETVTLSMNTYLQGVVRGEMQGDYPMDALKAQAVAARTYAYYLKASGKTHPGGACVCTDYTCCQAWAPVDPVWIYHARVQEAVETTGGIVVTYEGQPIKAMYFASSGGHTEDYAAVWNDFSYGYLQGVPSLNEQNYHFTDDVFVQEFSPWTILSQLRSNGYNIQCDSACLLENITDIQRSETGRVLSLTIDGVTIQGTEIRKILGLRSTHFYFQPTAAGGVSIVTLGFGHGVGMSQSGSAALAEEGYDYGKILKYYYTGVDLEWMPFR
ncbi:MAG: SpoIID/LytB domain-containing protein [Clostridia bacterium]|nr:SpoIID/LytB domain-containing protein [Clostridia bacterium]